jgi:hypothetical protein
MDALLISLLALLVLLAVIVPMLLWPAVAGLAVVAGVGFVRGRSQA